MNEKYRIMIVEDEFITAMELRDKVETMGFNVVGEASSGKDAIEQISKNPVDLILMDIRLKGEMDGISAVEIINQTFDIPVIYLTAYSDDNTMQRAKETRPFGYILKPFQDKELNTAIELAFFRHAMEKSLKEEDAWLASTLNCIRDGIIACDTEGQVKVINQTARTILKYTSDEGLGKDIRELIKFEKKENNGIGEHPCRMVLASGKEMWTDAKATLVNKAGQRIEVVVNAAPIKSVTSEIMGVLIQIRNNQ